MKGRLVALDHWNGAKAAALVVDGRLEDLLIDPLNIGAPTPGTIFRAIADRLMKGQGGVMVRLPGGRSGFLRQSGALKPGQSVLVQVTGYGEAAKAVPVTSKLLFKGRFAIVTPGAPGVNLSRTIREEAQREALLQLAAEVDLGTCGAILRSNAAGAAPSVVTAELRDLADRASAVLSEADGSTAALLQAGPDAHGQALRDWIVPDLFDDVTGCFARYGIDESIDTMCLARIELPGGATAWIELTHALVAVDVNTGPDTSPAAGLKANIALARDLPRQLRCRGLGGQITIDFAAMAKKDRRQVEQVLQSAFRVDAIETALVGWTPIGHFELQRKRERHPTV